MQFSSNDLHSSSINEILRKRHNTTERTAMKNQRPRSSKGYRGYATQSNSTSQIPKISSKSEERNLKSQGGHQRPMVPGSSKYTKGASTDANSSKLGLLGNNQGSNLQFNSLQNNNRQLVDQSHTKSQKPIEFKKIQNLSVKAGG